MSDQTITVFCCKPSTEHGFEYDRALHEYLVQEQLYLAEEAQREHAEDIAAQLAGPCEGCRGDVSEVGPLAIDGGEALCVACRGAACP